MALVGLEMELLLEDGREWCFLHDVMILEGMTVVALALRLESLAILGRRN